MQAVTAYRCGEVLFGSGRDRDPSRSPNRPHRECHHESPPTAKECPMNRYDRYPGDYLRDTLTLNLAQDGAYTRLLDYYYSTEQPIPADEAFAAARCRGPEDEAVTQWVLSRFFKLTDLGYVHERAEREIEKARPRIEAARANGRKGGRKKDTKNKPSGLPSGIPSTEPTTNPTPKLPSPSPSPSLELKEQQLLDTPVGVSDTGGEKIGRADAACQIVIDAYNAALPDCRRAGAVTDKRRRRIAAANALARRVIRSKGWLCDLPTFWECYFQQCAQDPWMAGKRPNPNNPAWRQNIDVLIADDRLATVVDTMIIAEDAA